jgi:hypothetical protein
MILEKLRGKGIRNSIVEFVLIVLGVLVALALDERREDLKARHFLTQQLESIVAEIDGNLKTIDRILTGAVPAKLTALEVVIATLDDPNPQIADLDGFLKELALGSLAADAWLSRSRYDALRSSGNFRIIGDEEIEKSLADTYEGISVLISQIAPMEAGYPELVNQLIPATYQVTLNGLSFYVPTGVEAPVVQDFQPKEETIAAIIGERNELMRLARAEVAVGTARWYALTRLKMQFEELRALMIKHPALKNSEFDGAQRPDQSTPARRAEQGATPRADAAEPATASSGQQ